MFLPFACNFGVLIREKGKKASAARNSLVELSVELHSRQDPRTEAKRGCSTTESSRAVNCIYQLRLPFPLMRTKYHATLPFSLIFGNICVLGEGADSTSLHI